MSNVFRRNRKGTDEEIVRLNSLGLSLSTIGKELHCHPTSVTLRLQSLGIPPADTRRAFMEYIFNNMPQGYRDSIANILAGDDPLHPRSICDHIRDLLMKDVEDRQAALPSPQPEPEPQAKELESTHAA